MEKSTKKLTIIYLAAGLSSRFGENKLLATEGFSDRKPLFLILLEKLCQLCENESFSTDRYPDNLQSDSQQLDNLNLSNPGAAEGGSDASFMVDSCFGSDSGSAFDFDSGSKSEAEFGAKSVLKSKPCTTQMEDSRSKFDAKSMPDSESGFDSRSDADSSLNSKGEIRSESGANSMPKLEFQTEIIVVTRSPEIMDICRKLPVKVVYSPDSVKGISYSIKAGILAASGFDSEMDEPKEPDCESDYKSESGLKSEPDYYAFFVADQPYLQLGTVRDFLSAALNSGKDMACVCSGGRTGNPAVFSAKLRPKLMKLEGDKGGKSIIKNHPDNTFYFEVPAGELRDIDTKSDLKIKN